MFSNIDTSGFFKKLLILIVFHHMESQLQLDLLKRVNQGVSPLKTPENGVLENPGHVFKDRQFWFFEMLLIWIILIILKDSYGQTPAKR